MNYTLMMGLGGVDSFLKIGCHAEKAGWGGISIPDSLFFPMANESEYPYADTEEVRAALENTPVLDPIVAMSMLAALTRDIQFYPGVMKIPVRQPVVLAKSITSLAYMSNNRLKLGAGLSPWKEDFLFSGIPWQNRGQRMDECIEIIRGLSSGHYFEYHGDFYDFSPIKMSPAPTRPVPIIIGGHSKAALDRAARIGDGWMSANSDLESLRDYVGTINELRRKYEREHEPFEFHCLDMAAQCEDDFSRLQEIGATHVCVTPWDPYDPTLAEEKKLEAVSRCAENFV